MLEVLAWIAYVVGMLILFWFFMTHGKDKIPAGWEECEECYGTGLCRYCDNGARCHECDGLKRVEING